MDKKLSEQEQHELALAEFAARGGVIQKIAQGVSGRPEGTGYSMWGTPKRPAAAVPVVKSVKKKT